MLFGEYVSLLRKFYKKTIGQQELCTTLFDFVIEPAELVNENNEVLTFEKSYISKIMNGTKQIHTKIRDHIYDQSVTEQLVENFQDVIIPELNPETEDLCFRMMQLIEQDNIAPGRMSNFRMLANKETLAAFLASVFVYAVVENGDNRAATDNKESQKKSGYKSNIMIKGIDNGNLSETARYESFLGRIGLSYELVITSIKRLFEEVNNIHLEKRNDIDSDKDYFFEQFKRDPYEIAKDDKDVIQNAAKVLEINLSDDFFDLGNLEKDILAMSIVTGKPDYRGTAEEEKKVVKIQHLLETIKKALRAMPYIKAFEDVKCLSLAVVNDGTDYDEDIIVDLYIDKDKLLTAEEMAKYDKKAIDYLLKDCDYGKQFEISRGIGYLDYYEAKNSQFAINQNIDSDIFPFGSSKRIDYVEAIKNLLGYYYCETAEGYLLEVKIDKINQHTGVAFPTVILVNQGIKSIRYSIKTKRNPNIIEGVCDVI